jgi:hypothetical protein
MSASPSRSPPSPAGGWVPPRPRAALPNLRHPNPQPHRYIIITNSPLLYSFFGPFFLSLLLWRCWDGPYQVASLRWQELEATSLANYQAGCYSLQ